MFYPLTLFIASRYSKSKQANSFISFITFFSVAGITLGVLALIIVLSVMNGFEGELKRRILGVVPHITVQHAAESPNTQVNNAKIDTAPLLKVLNQDPSFKAMTPFIQSIGMIQSTQTMSAIEIQGIQPSLEIPHSTVAQHMRAGSLAALEKRAYSVVIGNQLAAKLGVSIGDKVRLILSENPRYTPMGRMPVQRKMTISGIYDVGSEIDSKVVLVNFDDLARMLRLKAQAQQRYRIYLDDAFSASMLMPKLMAIDSVWQVSSWQQSQGKLFAAVKMEKNMMWLMLCLIVAVAAFNIVSALVMVVSDKQGEIATLKTMGLSAKQVQMLFLLQGLYKGTMGAILGCVIGLLLTYNLNTILSALGAAVFTTPGYAATGLPIDIRFEQVIVIALSAIGMSLAATIYPAFRAARTQPAVILRYE